MSLTPDQKGPSYVEDTANLIGLREITVGSSCTGLVTEHFALRHMLHLPIKHLFMCDNDRHVQLFLPDNFPSVPVVSSVLAPEHKDLPYVDIYVAGFPCQP